MRVYVESLLPCDAERAWLAVQTSALLLEVTAPVIFFRTPPGERLPERWTVGPKIQTRPRMLGVLPLGDWNLRFERIDADAREIQTRESGATIARWDHRIRIRPAGHGRCRYSDEIEVEAGWRTPFVWLFAHFLYRYRQWRWRRVARRLQADRISQEPTS